jgi:hypothetical protein
MSLEMRLGARGNLLQPGQDAYTQVLLKSPILLESQLEAVQVGGAGGRGCCDEGKRPVR